MTESDERVRSVKRVHRGRRADMPNLPTVQALPLSKIDQIDPFLFLNHHGPKQFPPDNDGLPFEPHPHRGMQTVTFIIDGDVMHRDNSGGEDIIEAGGVQWMVAGRGLLHSEVSSEAFKREGGPLEILQLWVNLPSELKSVEPAYYGLQEEEIPVLEEDEGAVRVQLIAGSRSGEEGAVDSPTDVELARLDLREGGCFEAEVDPSRNIFCYVVRGEVSVNGESVEAKRLVEFEEDGELVTMRADEPSLVLWGHAEPYDEPVVSRGPFVMNTEEEIRQAWQDLRSGKFGTWTAS